MIDVPTHFIQVPDSIIAIGDNIAKLRSWNPASSFYHLRIRKISNKLCRIKKKMVDKSIQGDRISTYCLRILSSLENDLEHLYLRIPGNVPLFQDKIISLLQGDRNRYWTISAISDALKAPRYLVHHLILTMLEGGILTEVRVVSLSLVNCHRVYRGHVAVKLNE